MQFSVASQVGVVVALGGPFAILLLGRALRLETFATAFRLAFWVTAIAVLVIMFAWEGQGLASIGLAHPGWRSLGIGVLAGIVMLPLFPLIPAILGRFGVAVNNAETFKQIAQQSFGQRLFLVLTAAVVEEILYRGYGIERMTLWVHSEWLAAGISVVAFTAAHFRWGAGHLITVFLVACGFSALYVWSRNLSACIIAHFIIDGVGFLLMPATMARMRPATG